MRRERDDGPLSATTHRPRNMHLRRGARSAGKNELLEWR